jgi:hypothetical protein
MNIKKNFSYCIAISLLIVACNAPNASDTPTATNGAPQNTESKQETPPEPMSKKKETLSKLVGEHNLYTISGFMGANTMIDYTLKNGKWSAIGSSLNMGEREAYDWDISNNDLKKLKSMKIIVNPDLSVTFSCNGKVYENIPFQEDGAKTSFREDQLFLFEREKYSEKKLGEIDIIGVSPNTLVISYQTKQNEFSVHLANSEMADSETYSFK